MTAARGFTMPELEEERKAQFAPTMGQAMRASDDFARLMAQPISFSSQEKSIILQTCCNGASKQEAEQLIAIAEARGLNPIKGECYFVQRWDSAKKLMVWAVQASIDSFRIKADETGLYDGQDEPEYAYDEKGQLQLAKVRVWRKGIARPFVGVARYDEYVQEAKDKESGKYRPTKFWARMPHNQLAKCAEALAFRKAFPARFSRIYTPEEMAQADNDAAPHDPVTGEVREPASQTPLPLMYAQRFIECVTAEQIDETFYSVQLDVRDGNLTPDQGNTLKATAKARKAAIVALREAEANAKAKRGEQPAREPGGDDV